MAANSVAFEADGAKNQPAASAQFDRLCLAIIVAVSLALRVTIAVRGGQYFWTDESAFVLSQRAAAAILTGHFHAGVDELFSHSAHMLFEVIGVIPAMAQIELGGLVWIPAVFFGCFSAGIVYLAARLVRALGGSSREGLFAALLMASCSSFFYYARHVFPYDLALFFTLCGALCGFRPGKGWSFLAGLLTSVGFLTYNAYWWFGGTVLILTIVGRHEQPRLKLGRAIASLAGLAVPILVVLGTARLLGHDLLREFSRHAYLVKVDTGDRGIAWRVIPEYLWDSERYLFILLAVCFLGALAFCATGRAEMRIKLWLAGAVLFYAGQVATFDVFKVFFVCARHARPLAIFLCLAGGWVLAKISNAGKYGRIAVAALEIMIILQAAYNFSTPLRQVFPVDFTKEAEAAIKKDAEFDPGLYRILPGGYEQPDEEMAVRKRPKLILLERPHPLEFIPYTFDDYTEVMRERFHSRDIAMKAVRLLPERPDFGAELPGTDGVWMPHEGAVRLGIIFKTGDSAEAQPIISTGSSGAGDELFVQFLGPETIRFGFDHWNAAVRFSRPIECNLKQPHLLTVSFGSLYPKDGNEFLAPEVVSLRHRLYLEFDGAILMSVAADCYPSAQQSVVLFHNLIGFSTAARDFSGRLLSANRVTPREIRAEINGN